MRSALLFLYAGLVLAQLTAVAAGLTAWFDPHWMVTGMAALVLASIPLIGSLIAVMGAVAAWGWSWLWATLLFAGLLLLVAGLLVRLVEQGASYAAKQKGSAV